MASINKQDVFRLVVDRWFSETNQVMKGWLVENIIGASYEDIDQWFSDWLRVAKEPMLSIREAANTRALIGERATISSEILNDDRLLEQFLKESLELVPFFLIDRHQFCGSAPWRYAQGRFDLVEEHAQSCMQCNLFVRQWPWKLLLERVTCEASCITYVEPYPDTHSFNDIVAIRALHQRSEQETCQAEDQDFVTKSFPWYEECVLSLIQ